jgi:hypothetical protein
MTLCLSRLSSRNLPISKASSGIFLICPTKSCRIHPWLQKQSWCRKTMSRHHWQDRGDSRIERRFYSTPTTFPLGKMEHQAFIALGSNIGDRIAWIEKACNLMESRGDIKIQRTSSLWETKAMYVEDQDNFINGACEV